jgi:arginyl-tRNA synthetase
MADSPLHLLRARVGAGVAAAFGADVEPPDPLVVPTSDPRHGDYTSAAAMALARALRRPPQELAERLAAALDVSDVCEPPEVVRPGFVNLRLRTAWLESRVAAMVGDDRLGVEPVAEPVRVVVDYSGPNVAKQMHVGHLRSTIIGDSLCNVLEFLGHDVERVNHLGDWGTQFGMLIAHVEDVHPGGLGGAEAGLDDLEALYRSANQRFGEDPAFRGRARQRVVDLQSGEPTARAAWQWMVDVSMARNQEVYDLLGVRNLVTRGESSYQPLLAEVVAELEAAGLVVVDDGAKCVFVEGFTNKDGDPLPLIVQKADGGYNYATTDLAALRSRVQHGARRLIYVTDAGQSQHFAMVFAVAARAGWLPPGVEVDHVPFGLVLGEGGGRLRTRSGDTVRLRDLLDEAVARARAFLVERAAERGEPVAPDVDEVARAVGVGAVKYGDLSQNRQSNYVFSYDRMLTLKGNTAPYLQYAYARIRSILREAGHGGEPVPGRGTVSLGEPQERDLARRLVALGDILDRVVADHLPSHLAAHLYELAQAYHQFYEHCPVLRAAEDVRRSRLTLCEATAASLRRGLGLLGIEVPERI